MFLAEERCDDHLEEMNQLLETQQEAYMTAFDKAEVSRLREIEARDQIGKLLVDKLFEIMSITKQQRVMQFYEVRFSPSFSVLFQQPLPLFLSLGIAALGPVCFSGLGNPHRPVSLVLSSRN